MIYLWTQLRRVSSTAISIVIVSCVYTQTTIPSIVEQQIDSLFSSYDRYDRPGYAIGISVEGQLFYKAAYGSANLDYNTPLTTASAFSIASVSKQFTGACLAILLMEKKLDLKDPIKKYLPEWGKYDREIRVEHLIYNTSGIQDYYRLPRSGGKTWITFNYFDVDECIDVSLQQDTLLFMPGNRWDYCNVNFMLLTKIIEKVSGLSFSEFAQTRLFEPLEMNATFVHDDVTQIVKYRATPYNLRTSENVAWYRQQGIHIDTAGSYIYHHRNAPHYGGSGVVSSIDDLLKWCNNMIHRDFGGSEFYDLMHRKGNFNHDRKNQAFGLYHGVYKGRKTVAWDGGDYGISSQILRFPEREVGIVVLSNFGSGRSFQKANEIADVLIRAGKL